MVSGDEQPCFSHLPQQPQRFTAIGVGPGLGQRLQTARALEALLQCGRPMVIDADALNLLAADPGLPGTGACRFYIDAASGRITEIGRGVGR